MSKKRKPTVDDLYDAKHYGKPSVSDNAPESSSLTPDERTYVEAGLAALALLRKTFESWVSVGRAIQTLRAKAVRMGTRKAFARLLDQQGFGEFNKDRATCTRLLRIMENLGEVSAWHAALEPKRQKAWAHPSTVFLHCPIFKKPKMMDISPDNIRKARPALAALTAFDGATKKTTPKEFADAFNVTDAHDELQRVLDWLNEVLALSKSRAVPRGNARSAKAGSAAA
jgi:hypothetical protein